MKKVIVWIMAALLVLTMGGGCSKDQGESTETEAYTTTGGSSVPTESSIPETEATEPSLPEIEPVETEPTSPDSGIVLPDEEF